MGLTIGESSANSPAIQTYDLEVSCLAFLRPPTFAWRSPLSLRGSQPSPALRPAAAPQHKAKKADQLNTQPYHWAGGEKGMWDDLRDADFDLLLKRLAVAG